MGTAKAPITPTIMGQGVNKAGQQVYAVQSRSEDLRWWLVVVERDGSLTCDCWAGRRHRACAHRGLVASERRMASVQVHQPAMASATALYPARPAFSGLYK